MHNNITQNSSPLEFSGRRRVQLSYGTYRYLLIDQNLISLSVVYNMQCKAEMCGRGRGSGCVRKLCAWKFADADWRGSLTQAWHPASSAHPPSPVSRISRCYSAKWWRTRSPLYPSHIPPPWPCSAAAAVNCTAVCQAASHAQTDWTMDIRLRRQRVGCTVDCRCRMEMKTWAVNWCRPRRPGRTVAHDCRSKFRVLGECRHGSESELRTRGLTADPTQHLPVDAVADADLWSESADWCGRNILGSAHFWCKGEIWEYNNNPLTSVWTKLFRL